jgi:ATP-dependent DNA helicase PIF1
MSSGLAKALVGQDNDFENAALPPHNSRQNPIYIHNSPTKNIDIPTLGVEFDENDFDSDIDLDEEDPATKATLSYPKLPAVPDRPNMEYGVMGKPDFLKSQLSGQAVSRNAEDSGYETQMSRRMPGAFPAALPQNHTIKRDPQPIATTNPPHVPSSPPPLNSSQPLPWSSSPEAHFKTPTKVTEIRKYGYVEPKKTAQEPEVKAEPKPRPKRRTIPWLEQQKQQQQQTAKVEADPTSTPRRGQPHKDGQNPGEFTPLPKDSAKNILWNTTASAVKQQQQQMREVNKKKSRTNEATQEERAEAKKRRTRLSKIFLSEEQQHVMSLVIDHKKSVFFTGSAGKCCDS